MSDPRGAALALAAMMTLGCGGEEAGAPPPSAPGEARVTGALVDARGEPLAGRDVLACMATVCLRGETGDDGGFAFTVEAPAEVAIKSPADLSTRPRQAAALYPFRVSEGAPDPVHLGALPVPELPDGAPLDGRGVEPVTFAAGDGLALTLRPDALTPPLGYALVDVAARAVPLAWMPPIPELGGETLVGVYALHPFGALSAEPIAVRAPSTLPAGTPVWFRTISELDGRCSEPVPGRADGRVVETTPSAGIDALTWLIISR